MNLEDYIIDVPDWPTKGVLFRDITGVLKDGKALRAAVEAIQDELKDVEFDAIVGPESRGFIFSMPVCYNMGKPFIPVRKPGKLPRATKSIQYDLEYGKDQLEVHTEDITPGMKIVIIDDLIATGGTNKAIVDMLESLGAKVVKAVYFIELLDLHGRDKMPELDIVSIIKYHGE